MARKRGREICRPDQANRATAVTSASFFGADDSTGCQRDNAGLRRSGKGSASVRPTSCYAIHCQEYFNEYVMSGCLATARSWAPA
jgi:hypothetical protein